MPPQAQDVTHYINTFMPCVSSVHVGCCSFYVHAYVEYVLGFSIGLVYTVHGEYCKLEPNTSTLM